MARSLFPSMSAFASDGFEATQYLLSTDQFGTQLDPPAHWAPEQAAIEMPVTIVTPSPAAARTMASSSGCSASFRSSVSLRRQSAAIAVSLFDAMADWMTTASE